MRDENPSEERDEIDDLYETQGEPVGLAAAFVARVERLFLKVMRFDEAENEVCEGA